EIKGIPGQKTYKNGDKCGDKTGEDKVYVNEKLRAGDPDKIKVTDSGHLVVAFVPKSVEPPVSELPSIKNLSNTNAAEPGKTGQTTGTNPVDLATLTTPPTTATTAAPGATTTTAPTGTTTATTTATTAAPTSTTKK